MLKESKYTTFVGRIDGWGLKLWWCFHLHVAWIVNEAIREFCFGFSEYMEKTKFAFGEKENWILWSDCARKVHQNETTTQHQAHVAR